MEERKKDNTIDMWRDSPVRYLGYANEVGESFRPLFPRMLIPSYLLSIGYVLGDTRDKYVKAKSQETSSSTSLSLSSPWISAMDALLWQSFASVIVPGITINRIVALSSKVWTGQGKQFGPTTIGLMMIPLIIHPIDVAVEGCMDIAVRPLYREKKEE